MFSESSHHKKYHGSCFMYLSEILSKLQTCEVTNFMTFSDGLLIYVMFYINHTYCNIFIFPWSYSLTEVQLCLFHVCR